MATFDEVLKQQQLQQAYQTAFMDRSISQTERKAAQTNYYKLYVQSQNPTQQQTGPVGPLQFGPEQGPIYQPQQTPTTSPTSIQAPSIFNQPDEEYIGPSGPGTFDTAGQGAGTQGGSSTGNGNYAGGTSQPGSGLTILPPTQMPTAAQTIDQAARYANTPEDLGYQRGRGNIRQARRGILSTITGGNKSSSNPLLERPSLLGS